MDKKVAKFVDLVEYLYKRKWGYFFLSDKEWTSSLEGEEKIFGIVIRTLLCNDASSERFFRDIGGFEGAKSMYNSGEGFNILVERKSDYPMGTGKGSHRDNRHRDGTVATIEGYLNLTHCEQEKYLANVRGYRELFNDFDGLKSVGPLTAFDLTKSLYEGKVIRLLPDGFYLTGGGQIRGMKALYPGISKAGLVEKGNELMQIVRNRTDMPEESLVFGLEDLLCIYQKKDYHKKFLECEISVEELGSRLLNRAYCRERGIC